MKIVRLNNDNVKQFIAYSRKYAKEQDESNLPADDYKPRNNGDEPAFILLNDDGEIAGAAVLILHREYRELKKGRLSVFHCTHKSTESYRPLLEAIINECEGIENIYCFVTDDKTDIINVWEQLGFEIERYSWVLERGTEGISSYEFNNGFTICKLEECKDENSWCDVINDAFAEMNGHTHLRPGKIDVWRKDPTYIDGGMNLLWCNNEPVGTIQIRKENENGENLVFIDAIGVIKKFQKRGLGKNLLRFGVDFGRKMGIKKVMLSVNAENDRAAELYINEGFKKIETYICYNKKL